MPCVVVQLHSAFCSFITKTSRVYHSCFEANATENRCGFKSKVENYLDCRVIWIAELSGLRSYLDCRVIWIAELSGLPSHLDCRVIWFAELSGFLSYLDC
ncbi:hypothetical protein TNCV_239911 [Trichonephila clavipes]|nr:hypothetical protein TNCV_239911 [Trichonephila clavipes]